MAARSTTVNLTNNADVALVRNSGSLSHGEWDTEPPLRVEVGQSVSWESESDGVATGTEGEVFYDIETAPGQTGGQAHFHWDNPFIGSNSYDESTPDGYKADRSGGSGNDATVDWTFDCASATCDGIPDDWKLDGVTLDPGDGSGPQFIDLPAMGATVGKPDIFVQIDWMADGTHSHKLSAAAIETVVDAFANCPYVSRTGSVGINLHVDAGPNSILDFSTNQTWGALSRAQQLSEVTNLGTGTVTNGNVSNYSWTAFDTIKNQPGGFTGTGRTPIFRYCVSGHQIATANNSGIARAIPGSDLIVSLAAFVPVTDDDMAGTFMHELGHTLGLDHGGGDPTNNKPNYVSVMNYLWQTTGLTRGGVASIFDYSNAALLQLTEGSLDETVGVGPAAAGVAIKHWSPPAGGNPGAFVQVADGSKPIDWDGNGKTTDTNLSFDTNNDGSTLPLAPYDDWKNLKLKGGAIGAGGQYPPPAESSIVELTPADRALILPADTTPPVTTATLTPAPNAAGWNRTPVAVAFTATDDISGVALTEVEVDGALPVAVTGPVLLTAEGVHGLAYHSVDRSQNVEPVQHLDVRIDLTAPEAVISYDPVTDEVVVTGRDALSGVDPGPVSPSSVTPVDWTDFGSDVAELRVYRIRDHADNETILRLKLRCAPVSYELSVLDVRYDDEQQSSFRGERNTIVFDRVVGRGAAHPLLGVEQVVAIGAGAARTTVRVRYDVLDDESLVVHETGSYCCSDDAGAAGEAETRGLVGLSVVTGRGGLTVEE